MGEINRFELEDEVFIDTKSTAEDGGKQTYWVIEYKQRQQLLNRVNELASENEKLKQENQRMTNKLNELALEFLNHDMISMGKATEISEMCYHDFLKYRKENGNPMELQL